MGSQEFILILIAFFFVFGCSSSHVLADTGKPPAHGIQSLEDDLRIIQKEILSKRLTQLPHLTYAKPYEAIGIHLEAIARWVSHNCPHSTHSASDYSESDLISAVNELKDYMNLIAMSKKSWERPIKALVAELSPASQFKKNPEKLKLIWDRASWCHPEKAPPVIQNQSSNDRSPVIIEPIPAEAEESENPETHLIFKNPSVEENPVLSSSSNTDLENPSSDGSLVIEPISLEKSSSGFSVTSSDLSPRTETIKKTQASFFKKFKNFFSDFSEERKNKKRNARVKKILEEWKKIASDFAKKIQVEDKWIEDYHRGRLRDYVYVRADWSWRMKKVHDQLSANTKLTKDPIHQSLRQEPVDQHLEKKLEYLDQLEVLLYLDFIIQELGISEVDWVVQSFKFEPIEKLIHSRDLTKITQVVDYFAKPPT